MKQKSLRIALGGLALLMGCNNMASREDLVATVGGTPVYRTEIDFVTSTMPSNMRTGEARDEAIRSMLETRQKAEAARRYLGDPKGSVALRLEFQNNRSLAQIYQYFYLQENLGQSTDSLLAYYRRHQGQYAADTAAKGDFAVLRARIAQDRFLESRKDSVRAFYESNKQRFQVPATYQVLVLQSADSTKVAESLRLLSEGFSPDSIAERNEDPALKGKSAFLTTSVQMRHPVLGAMGLYPEALVDAGRFAVGNMGSVQKSEGTYRSYRIMSRKEAYLPPLDSVWKRVSDMYTTQYRRRVSEESPALLRTRYGVVLETIKPEGVEAYYAKNKEQFQTQPAFHLHHIEMSDSLALAKELETIATLDSFEAKAGRLSENAWTRFRKGDIGKVKVGHCMPWGIGMFSDLFDTLQGKQPGYRTAILKAPDTQKFHVFWLDSVIAPQQKPFDRARMAIIKALSGQGDFPLDSNTVLARIGNEPLVRESDVLRLSAEIPPSQRMEFNREKLVGFLVDWAVAARAAIEAGLDRTSDYQSWRRIMGDQLYAQLLQDSLLYLTLGRSEADLKAEYAKNPDSLFKSPFAEARPDVATWLQVPDIAFRREFALNPSVYAGFSDWKAARTAIYPRIRQAEFQSAQRRLLFKYQQEFPIVVLDSSIRYERFLEKEDLRSAAKSAYAQRKLDQALEQWNALRDYFSTDDSLQMDATLEIAKLYNEMERFSEAAREYQVYAALWPHSPEAYKALFMQGFILSENLKQDSLALPVFRSLLQRYPKTDLTDDAEWMIKNIESGGQLVPALLDSLEQTDSSAVMPSSVPATSESSTPPAGASRQTESPAAQPASKP